MASRAPRRLLVERAKLEKIAAGEGAEGGSGGAGGADAGEGAESWFSLADGDDTFVWHITILGPKTYAVNPDPEGRERGEERPSPYADGMFELQVDFSPSYPMVPPKIKFLTPVYHPNVRKEGAEMGQMCSDFVTKEWKPNLTVHDLLVKVLSLLASPNPDEPLEGEIGRQMQDDLEAFEATARKWVKDHCD